MFHLLHTTLVILAFLVRECGASATHHKWCLPIWISRRWGGRSPILSLRASCAATYRTHHRIYRVWRYPSPTAATVTITHHQSSSLSGLPFGHRVLPISRNPTNAFSAAATRSSGVIQKYRLRIICLYMRRRLRHTKTMPDCFTSCCTRLAKCHQPTNAGLGTSSPHKQSCRPRERPVNIVKGGCCPRTRRTIGQASVSLTRSGASLRLLPGAESRKYFCYPRSMGSDS